MNLILVYFKAYGHECIEPFLDKTMLQIHKELQERCETYLPTKIERFDMAGKVTPEIIDMAELVKYKDAVWEELFELYLNPALAKEDARKQVIQKFEIKRKII